LRLYRHERAVTSQYRRHPNPDLPLLALLWRISRCLGGVWQALSASRSTSFGANIPPRRDWSRHALRGFRLMSAFRAITSASPPAADILVAVT